MLFCQPLLLDWQSSREVGIDTSKYNDGHNLNWEWKRGMEELGIENWELGIGTNQQSTVNSQQSTVNSQQPLNVLELV